jgi:hypothetical protein
MRSKIRNKFEASHIKALYCQKQDNCKDLKTHNKFEASHIKALYCQKQDDCKDLHPYQKEEGMKMNQYAR